LGLLFCSAGTLRGADPLPGVRFSDYPETVREADEGWLSLDWAVADETLPAEAEFVVEQASTASFSDPREKYRGRDGATFISGLPEGAYFYRVRIETDERAGPWSEVLEVDVDYGNRTQVWVLMGAGTVAFLATVGTLIANHQRTSGERLEA